MACYYPMEGFRSRVVGKNGRRGVVFNKREGFSDLPVTVPCGKCIGCKLEHSRQWAIRCMHEKSLHLDNSFITLTYSDEHLPSDRSLDKSHFQKFIKRLRQRYSSTAFRYFHCGEYGERLSRPHYHALLFGFDFADKRPAGKSKSGETHFTSSTLNEVWGMGECWIGSVTFESAAYCARYCTKKITGDMAKSHYEILLEDTGEIISVLPEYATMSLNPAIGKRWYQTFGAETHPTDSVVMRGMEMKPPRYYDKLREQDDAKGAQSTKYARLKKAAKTKSDRTPERLRVRETVAKSRAGLHKRNL